jgi:hypothetical protein
MTQYIEHLGKDSLLAECESFGTSSTDCHASIPFAPNGSRVSGEVRSMRCLDALHDILVELLASPQLNTEVKRPKLLVSS